MREGEKYIFICLFNSQILDINIKKQYYICINIKGVNVYAESDAYI